jgi:hypothetical protein
MQPALDAIYRAFINNPNPLTMLAVYSIILGILARRQ